MTSETRKQQALRVLARLGRYLTPAWLAAICVLAITSATLFVPPYVGMADNGDYFRIAYSNGLYFNAPDYDAQYLGYFVKDYGILQYYNENGATMSSSQSLFIRGAIALNQLLFNQATFDIRFQAAIYTVLLSVAVYLLVESLTWKFPGKYGYPIALLAVFMFADSAYTAYFSSFYSESVVYLSLMLLLAAGLLFYRKRYNDYVLLALFTVSGLLLTTSKQQNAPIGLIIAFLGILFIFVRKQNAFRSFMAAGLASVMIAGVATYVLIPQEFVNINKYHAMTRGVLLGADDPEQSLERFNIDRQYAILSGSIYYEPYTTIDVDSELLQEHFYNHYGFGAILGYYLANPEQARSMLNLAANHAFTIRPAAMGNFEQSEGKAFGAQTIFFSAYSALKESLAPRTFGFIVIWLLIVIGLYTPSFAAAIRERSVRRMLRLPLIIMIIVIGLSGILVSLIGAGDADLAKHQFLFTAAFDLITFLTISDLIRRQTWQDDREAAEVAPA
jgi:hypothetical protein